MGKKEMYCYCIKRLKGTKIVIFQSIRPLYASCNDKQFIFCPMRRSIYYAFCDCKLSLSRIWNFSFQYILHSLTSFILPFLLHSISHTCRPVGLKVSFHFVPFIFFIMNKETYKPPFGRPNSFLPDSVK